MIQVFRRDIIFRNFVGRDLGNIRVFGILDPVHGLGLERVTFLLQFLDALGGSPGETREILSATLLACRIRVILYPLGSSHHNLRTFGCLRRHA